MSDIADRLAKLQQRASSEPISFEFEEGNSIAGSVVDVQHRIGYEGVPYIAPVIETLDGDYVLLHLFHSVAKEKIEETGLQVGDLIAATYHGQVAPKKNPRGKKYHSWTILVDTSDRPATTAAPQWSADDAEAPGLSPDTENNPFH